MTRQKFTKKINQQASKLTELQIVMFKDFMLLNEVSSDYLDANKKEILKSHKQALENDNELKEKYYIYHLSKTINTKWKQFDLDKIVNHFYKNSTEIKRIYEG